MKSILIYITTILIGLASCENNKSQKDMTPNKTREEDPSTILKIISSNPSYIPNQEQQKQAKDFLITIFPLRKIESTLNDAIEFVDQGQNFDSIICPFCKKNIDVEYWQEAMEKADQTHFTDLSIKTSCCEKSTSLNDLKYITTAGFAKFVISVNDPEAEMKEGDLTALQEILDTPLRTIYAHY